MQMTYVKSGDSLFAVFFCRRN